MKIKLSNLKNLIENFLREGNPYDEEETSKKRDDDLLQSLSDIEKDNLVSDESKRLRKQGVKIKPRMFNAMMKDYRKLVLFLIDARDKLDDDDPDRAEIILSIRKLYDAAEDIKKGNNADALKKFKDVSNFKATHDLLTKDERPRKDFIEIRKTIRQAIKAGKKKADKIDSEDFLLSPTQDEIKAKEKEEKEKEKAGEAGSEIGKKIGDLQKKTKDSLSKSAGVLGDKLVVDGTDDKEKVQKIQELLKKLNIKDYEDKDLTADGVWGARTRSASSKALSTLNSMSDDPDPETGEEGTNLMKDMGLNDKLNDPKFDELNTKKEGKEGSWGKLSMELVPSNRLKVIGNDETSALLYVLEKYVKSDEMVTSGEEKTEPEEKDPPKKDPASSNWKDNRPKTIEETRELVDKLNKAYSKYYDAAKAQSLGSDIAMSALYESESPGIHICFLRSLDEFKKIHGGSFEDFVQYASPMDPDGSRKSQIRKSLQGKGDELIGYANYKHNKNNMVVGDLFFDDKKSALLVDTFGDDYVVPDVKITTKEIDGKEEMFIKVNPVPAKAK